MILMVEDPPPHNNLFMMILAFYYFFTLPQKIISLLAMIKGKIFARLSKISWLYNAYLVVRKNIVAFKALIF
jgi:hypothetical protein